MVARALALALLAPLAALAARDFTDDAGRKVSLPDKVTRVYAAGPPASVLVFALAPETLLGDIARWPTLVHPEDRAAFQAENERVNRTGEPFSMDYRIVAGDGASYRYLAESIRVHPDQATLKAMMKDAGFGHVDVHNLAAGVVALHVGIKC